jgi:hypothetical protein
MAQNNKDTNSVRLNTDVCIFTVESSSEKLKKECVNKMLTREDAWKTKGKNVKYFKNKAIYQNPQSSTKYFLFTLSA